MASKNLAKIPVTILTGFLGSGKTTFVNYVLKEQHGQRLAIIENEFGEVGVDDGLLVQSKEEVIEMMNGCICCTVRDDLREALKRLAKEQRDKFDAVLIETTGLADPAPVAQTFFVDDDIAELYALDAIITFVDAKHTLAHLQELKPAGVENEAVEQVAFADVLVVNKVDLASSEQLAALKDKLQQINSAARMLECSHSRVPLADVLNIGAFDLARTLRLDDQFLLVDQEHQHDTSVTSVGVCLEGEFIADKFQTWLTTLLRDQGADIFRSKGILCMLGSPERYVFHGVHMLLNMGSSSQLGLPLPHWQPAEKKLNKLCFIGRNLDRQALATALQACIFNGNYPDPGHPPQTDLRFKVGDRVRANVGTWTAGRIVALWYREPLWETGHFAPYQIQLDNGGLIYAPRDSRAFVRQI